MPTSSASPVGAPPTTRFHLAVVAGPDPGWVAPLGPDPVLVGRAPTATLPIEDPLLSREHVLVSARSGRVRARDLRSANGTALVRARRSRHHPPRPGRRTRRLRTRWRTIGEGDLLRVGGSLLEVRRHPSLRVPPDPLTPAPAVDGMLGRLLFPLLMCLGSVPLLLSGTGTWRLVLAIALPVVLVGSVLWPVLAQRRQRLGPADPEPAAPDPAPDPGPDDPAALLLRAGAPVPPTERSVRRTPRPGATVQPTWEIGTAGGPTRTGPPPSSARARRARERARYLPAATGGLALVGADADVTALARWLVCRLAVHLPAAELHLDLPAAWTWAAALPHRAPGGGQERVTVRLTGRAGPMPGAGVTLILARTLADVPGWCARTVEIHPGHDRRVGERWAATVCARIAAADHDAGALATEVPLGAVIGPEDVAGILAGWASGTGLPAVLGIGAAGPLRLDLTRDGPHALIAGTTGSGKSELLLAWLLGLAHARSPADLALVLVDYKGGATFAPVAALPHVAGLLTDLDPSDTARALASLRAELRRRERLLAGSGSATLAEHRARVPPPERPPALVVMVDEFRAMADEHPDFLDGLVRLAAQGRSLGIHLVLATQRPAGAVTPDMRANLTVRICLRVLEDTDSIDLVGDASAARLPPVPGRAVVLAGERTVVQVPWTGPSEAGAVPALVARLRAAAAALESGEPWRASRPRPWADPLPDRFDVDDDDVTDLAARAAAEPVERARSTIGPLLRLDLPDAQTLGTWSCAPGTTLLVSGPSGSGRTTVLRTCAELAHRAGLGTHVIAEDVAAIVAPPQQDAATRGTHCPPVDTRRARRLLDLLTAGDRAPSVLLVDDLDLLCRSLDETGGIGTGIDLVTALLRRARRVGVTVVATCSGVPTRWAPLVTDRLALRPQDVGDAVLAGVPRDLVGTGWPPGRGVLLGPGPARVAQVALARPRPDRYVLPAAPPVRLAPLPTRVTLAEVEPRVRATADPVPGPGPLRHPLLLGVGGDEAAPLRRDLPDGGTWLVAGPSGSGRSTALRLLSAQLRTGGRTVLDGLDGLDAFRHDPTGTADEPGPASPRGRRLGPVLLLDDVDRLPAAVLTTVADACDRHGLALVGAARPDALLGLYHEVGARLREAPLMIVLGPAGPAAHLAGVDLRRHADDDPGPGRGILLDSGRLTPMQLAVPDPPGRADPIGEARRMGPGV